MLVYFANEIFPERAIMCTGIHKTEIGVIEEISDMLKCDVQNVKLLGINKIKVSLEPTYDMDGRHDRDYTFTLVTSELKR